MRANRRSIGSDLEKVDRHVVQPHEYDELPELTDEMVARAIFKSGGPPERPSDFDQAAHAGVLVRLDPEIADRLQVEGHGLQARVNLILREWLERQPA